MLSAHTVQSQHADVCQYLQGDYEAVATNCRVPNEAGTDSLVFVSDVTQLAIARQRGAAILVVQRSLVDQLAPGEPAFGCCFAVASVPMGMARLLKHFDRKRERFRVGRRDPNGCRARR
jgi:hypothetical protein